MLSYQLESVACSGAVVIRRVSQSPQHRAHHIKIVKSFLCTRPYPGIFQTNEKLESELLGLDW
jgi:hypothetical protein